MIEDNKKSLQDKIKFFLWFILGVIFSFFSRLRRIKTIKKIIIFPQSKIGDFITQTPIFREIKLKYPTSEISLVTTKAELLPLLVANPWVDKIYVWDEKGSIWKKTDLFLKLTFSFFDLGINLSCEFWVDQIFSYLLIPQKITLLVKKVNFFLRAFYRFGKFNYLIYNKGYYSSSVYLSLLRFIGINSQNTKREVYILPECEESIEKFILAKNPEKKPLVGVVVSTGNKIKEIPLPKLVLISQNLIQNLDLRLVLIGDISQKEKANQINTNIGNQAINTTGLFHLGQLAALCKRLSLLISTDSGPAHIAYALGTPLVLISGPIDIEEQYRICANIKVIKSSLACAPCSFVSETKRICPKPKRICLDELSEKDILIKTKELLCI